jgi:ATPase subunit of ABC transporter with duplicated ATPase domains
VVAMIIGKNVSLTYDGKPILNAVDFVISNNKKIGIVGRNGCGKTSFFKIINGVEPVTDGSINIEGEKLAYLPQEFDFPDAFVGEYMESKLENSWDSYKIDMLIEELKFKNYDEYQKISLLSEGQKMKLKLMELLLADPTTLFIDEPTNHLDIEGIMWFEEYLKRLNKTVVMISHDRSFLNHTVDEIWEIENTKIFAFVGDYDNYKTEKLKLIDKWDEEYKRFLIKKAQMEKLIANARKITDGKKRGRAVESAKKRYEREVTRKAKEKYVIKKIGDIEFDTDVRGRKLMLRFDNVTKKYEKNTVFTDLSFEVRGGERIWLFGPNGAGKSTLVKLIMGDEKVTKGEVKLGENINVGYFAQKQTHLDYDKNLLDQFLAETQCEYSQAFGALKRFLFSGDDLKKRIKNLSPGERSRFAFAIFAFKDYDMLILDEPTNHLDIETKEVIEKNLSEYKGNLLLVSHDRYFVENVDIQKLLRLDQGKLEYV